MCGILGSFRLGENSLEQKEKIFEITTAIFQETLIRGKDASGFAFMDSDNSIKYAKAPLTSAELVEDKSWLSLKEKSPKIMIAHCRYGTKGSEMNNLNNHPLIIEEQGVEELALIHNGMVSNDTDIRDKHKSWNWKAEVDTEVIPTLIQNNIKSLCEESGKTPNKEIIQEAIKKSTKQLSGSFACALINKYTPNTLYLFKHNNPIVLAFCEKLNTIFFASTPEIINKAFCLKGQNLEEKLGVFSAFKLDYLSSEMAENEMFALSVDEQGKLSIDKDKFKAKEYVFSGGGNWGGHGRGYQQNLNNSWEYEDGEWTYDEGVSVWKPKKGLNKPSFHNDYYGD